MLSDAKKKANAKWDKAHMMILGCKVRKDFAAQFREACTAAGTTPQRCSETGSGTVFERTRGIRGENRRGRMRIISIRKDRCNMSTRELARILLDEMPDNDLIYLVAYMQSLKALKDAEIPNAKTQAAIDEVDSMIRTGEGEHFEGSTADFFAQLAAEG